jgi:tetratricopeptide (TPR) repeat protein
VRARWTLGAIAVAALIAVAPIGDATAMLVASAASPCPPETAGLVGRGWSAYRGDSLLVALTAFDRALQLCPGEGDAVAGLGFANLHLGYLMRAESLFTVLTEADAANSDGWDGLMSAAYRLGDYAVAMAAARRSWSLHQTPEARLILDKIYPGWDRPARPRTARPDSLVVPVRAANERFEVREGRSWRPLFVKGVALSANDRSPAVEDSAQASAWLAGVAGLNANTVRADAPLPSGFYRALAAWNHAHPTRALWLLQGVPVGPPPRGDAQDAARLEHGRAAMRQAVDLIHDSGDAARWTLGWIVSCAWDTRALHIYQRRVPGRHMSAGRYLALADGSSAEAWLAARCDELAAYEAERYGTLRPVSCLATGLPAPTLAPQAGNDAGWFESREINPASDRDVLELLGRRTAGGAPLVLGYGRGPASLAGATTASETWDTDVAGESAARLARAIRSGGAAGGVFRFGAAEPPAVYGALRGAWAEPARPKSGATALPPGKKRGGE